MCLLSSSNPSNSNSKKPSNSFKKLSSSPLSPSNSPKTLQILKNPFQKPGKFRDSSPRRTKERKKGKGSEKKDKPISTLRSHPTPSFFPREKRKGKKKNTHPFAMHNHALPPRPSPRATSSGKPPSSLSKSITASGRVPPPPHDFLFLDSRRENPPPTPPPHSPRTRFAHELFTTGRKWLSIDNPASTARFHRYKRRESERANERERERQRERWRYR